MNKSGRLALQWGSLGGFGILSGVWIQQANSPDWAGFRSGFFIGALVCMGVFIGLYLWNWRLKWGVLKEEVYELVAFRSEVSLQSLAHAKMVSLWGIRDLISALLQEQRIMGHVEGDHLIMQEGAQPKCGICHQNIPRPTDQLACPHCKRRFHRQHLIEYLEAQQNRCPCCSGPLKYQDFL